MVVPFPRDKQKYFSNSRARSLLLLHRTPVSHGHSDNTNRAQINIVWSYDIITVAIDSQKGRPLRPCVRPSLIYLCRVQHRCCVTVQSAYQGLAEQRGGAGQRGQQEETRHGGGDGSRRMAKCACRVGKAASWRCCRGVAHREGLLSFSGFQNGQVWSWWARGKKPQRSRILLSIFALLTVARRTTDCFL